MPAVEAAATVEEKDAILTNGVYQYPDMWHTTAEPPTIKARLTTAEVPSAREGIEEGDRIEEESKD